MVRFFKMRSQPSQRKSLLLGGKVQRKVISRLTIYWFLYHFVMWHFLLAYRYVEMFLAQGRPEASFRELYADFTLQNYPILISALVMLPLFLLDVLRVTHRIAGPLVRFQQKLKQMTAGEAVPKMRLRKGDYLQDLETAFNEYIDHYEQRRLTDSCEFRMTQNDAKLIEKVTELRKAVETHSS